MYYDGVNFRQVVRLVVTPAAYGSANSQSSC